jgi:hypothetical protein
MGVSGVESGMDMLVRCSSRCLTCAVNLLGKECVWRLGMGLGWIGWDKYLWRFS